MMEVNGDNGTIVPVEPTEPQKYSMPLTTLRWEQFLTQAAQLGYGLTEASWKHINAVAGECGECYEFRVVVTSDLHQVSLSQTIFDVNAMTWWTPVPVMGISSIKWGSDVVVPQVS